MITTTSVGIALAFVAMLCWGFGDFLIQRSTRTVGNWKALFFISFFGALVLLPFVSNKLGDLLNLGFTDILIIASACVILFVAALLDFEALRRGKLAVVEPIWSLEVPVAAVLAFVLIGEHISFVQIVLILSLIICLILVGIRQKSLRASMFLERGVFVAILGALFMGAANFFMGWGGRVTDPVMINFLSDVFLLFMTSIYLFSNGQMSHIVTDLRHNFALLLPMSISDKVAWLAFVFAMTLAPIAVATALSESYIIIAVLLGLVINREKLYFHQRVGLVGAIVTAVILAVITGA